jgi:hypothetical protein
MVETEPEGLIAQIEAILAELQVAIEGGGDPSLVARAHALAAVTGQLATVTRALGEVPAPLRARYQACMLQANVLVVSCFWRVTVVANLLRDLGLDSGVYRPEGGVALLSAESMSRLA